MQNEFLSYSLTIIFNIRCILNTPIIPSRRRDADLHFIFFLLDDFLNTFCRFLTLLLK